MKSEKNTKVVVAMSGGVDSSVAAAILKEKGYNCVGVYMQFWSDPKTNVKSAENKCCSLESLKRAQRIAGKLLMPVCVLDVGKKFKEKVVDYFINEHKKIKTPNPCIECNRNIKFGELLSWAKSMGASFIATGHYAKIKKCKGVYELHKGGDSDKDQSYFLYKLTQDQLKHVIFPLDKYSKQQVRALALKYGIGEAAKSRESQGICFFPEKEHAPFLKRYLPKKYLKKGPIKTEDGKVIGQHEGLALYTIGQRKGIKIGGEHDPWYVARLDSKNNALIVGKNKDTFTKKLKIRDLIFTSGPPKTKTLKVKAKIRHRFPESPAILEIRGTKGVLEFAEAQRAAAKGQSVVFYQGSKVVGGGEIM